MSSTPAPFTVFGHTKDVARTVLRTFLNQGLKTLVVDVKSDGIWLNRMTTIILYNAQ